MKRSLPNRSLYTTAALCALMSFGTTHPTSAAERMDVCDNELTCIEELYEKKKYDPMEFSELKLILGARNTVSFDDNIFRAPSDTESDIINRFSPKVVVEGDYEDVMFEFTTKAESGIYLENSENDYTDFSSDLDASYMLSDSDALNIGAGYYYDHVGIGSFVEDPDRGAAEPTPFHNVVAYAELDGRAQNQLHYVGRFEFNKYNYQNVDRRGGGKNIQDDRDRSEYGGSLLLGYPVDENMEVYVKGVYEEWQHDNRIDSSAAFTRDSNQYRALVGLQSIEEKSYPLSYDVAVGYLEQSYDAAALPDVDGLDIYANARWHVDEQNSLRLRLNREVRDAYNTRASGYLRTRARLNYEHDYSEQLALGAGVSYINDNFESLSSAPFDREDDTYGAHLWSEYEFIEDLAANLYYSYNDRDSNDADAEYQENIVGISLSYKY